MATAGGVLLPDIYRAAGVDRVLKAEVLSLW
jgi:hypothetical protein